MNINEIMYVVNNDESHKIFKKKEKILWKAFICACVFFFLFNEIFVLELFRTKRIVNRKLTKRLYTLWALLYFFVPYIFMSIILCKLLSVMAKFHNFEMKKVRTFLIFYAIFELHDVFIMAVLPNFIDQQFYTLMFEINIVLGGYLFMQAFAIIVVKQSKDPLEGISKIGYLQLISSFQRPNHDFMTNILQN